MLPRPPKPRCPGPTQRLPCRRPRPRRAPRGWRPPWTPAQGQQGTAPSSAERPRAAAGHRLRTPRRATPRPGGRPARSWASPPAPPRALGRRRQALRPLLSGSGRRTPRGGARGRPRPWPAPRPCARVAAAMQLRGCPLRSRETPLSTGRLPACPARRQPFASAAQTSWTALPRRTRRPTVKRASQTRPCGALRSHPTSQSSSRPRP